MASLSVVVNTLNAERYLKECLQSVSTIASEIIVVDMHSDDQTVAIAKEFTEKIYLHTRCGYVEPARNFAIEKASGDWVLVLDADERISPALAAAIPELITQPKGADIYLLPFDVFIVGRIMEGSGWGRDQEWHARLFRRGSLVWPSKIHAPPVFNGQSIKASLPPDAAVLHINFEKISDFIARLDQYTDKEADALVAEGKIWSVEDMLRDFNAELRARYQPHLDGVHSLVFSVFMGFYRFLVKAKLWERLQCPVDILPDHLSLPGKPEEESRAESALALRLLSGFHDNEGQWRWMSRKGIMTLHKQGQGTASVRFAVSNSDDPRAYPLPFAVTVRLNTSVVSAFSFSTPGELKQVEIALPPHENESKLEITSERWFIPVHLGINSDERELSLRIGNIRIQSEI